MKTLLRYLAVCMLALSMAATSHGRPWWKAIDADTKDAPSRYGYEIQRTDRNGVSYIIVNVDSVAASVLVQAEVVGGEGGVSNIPILREENGSAKLEFSIPAGLLPKASLRLNSGVIKYCGPRNLHNFEGYNIRLDNLFHGPDIGQPFKIKANIGNETAEFILKFESKQRISSEPLDRIPRLVSLSLESVDSKQLMIPLPIVASDILNNETKFSIPSEKLQDVVLVAKITDQSDFTGEKVRTHIVGLGILAAKAEQANDGH